MGVFHNQKTMPDTKIQVTTNPDSISLTDQCDWCCGMSVLFRVLPLTGAESRNLSASVFSFASDDN